MSEDEKPAKPRKERVNLSAEDRAARDALILNLFLSAWSERDIGRHPRVKLSGPRVHRIIQEQLKLAGERYGLVSKKALVIYSERLEMLLKAIWPKAVGDRDPKAIEVARRLLEQQGKFFGVTDEDRPMPESPMGDNEIVDDVTDLKRWRDRHRKPPGEVG
jgi:hypothetical protein